MMTFNFKNPAMQINLFIRGLISVLLLGMLGSSCAQSEQPNVLPQDIPSKKVYAPALVDSVKNVRTLAKEAFFNTGNSTEERLEAISRLGYPDNETFKALFQVAVDSNENDKVRLAALKKHRYDEKYFDKVLSILSDPNESEELVAGLIEDIGRRTTFRQPAEMQQRLQNALRERLNDSRQSVRLAAYRILVASHDAVAIDKLVEGLRSNASPIPLPDAIDLLDMDGSNKHIVTLRPFLSNPNPDVQAQAARALAVDPESRPTIISLANNAKAPLAVRSHALRALSREDKGFMAYAIRLVGNSKEKADIRYEAMKGAMRRLNYQNEPAATQVNFALAVQRLSSERGVITTDKRDVGAEAKELFAHLLKSFPAIKKHFGN